MDFAQLDESYTPHLGDLDDVSVVGNDDDGSRNPRPTYRRCVRMEIIVHHRLVC